MKRCWTLVLALFLVATLCACEEIVEEETLLGFKMVVLTGAIVDDEAAYLFAEKAVKIYGSDTLIHKSTPANFREKLWFDAFLADLLEDPSVKVLIINPAIEHFDGIFEKIRKTLPDMLIVIIRPWASDKISEIADIVLDVNELALGRIIPEQAKKSGAKTLVHYFVPRHMGYPLPLKIQNTMKEVCREINLEFVVAEAPDPLDDSSVPGAYQFAIDDIPLKVKEYGKDICFYTTAWIMREPLISATVEEGAIFAQPFFFGELDFYRNVLDIGWNDKSIGDVKLMNQKTAAKIEDLGMSGRFSIWPIPAAMLMGTAAVEYSLAYCQGDADREADKDLLLKCLQKAMTDYGYGNHNVHVNLAEGTDNFFLITEDYITY